MNFQSDLYEYGHHLKDQHFLLNKQLINLNHGSFGTVPKLIFEKQHQISLEQENSPEDWFRYIYQPYIDKSRTAIASLIKSDLNDVVLVESASYAVNSVLRSYPFKKDDIVIHFSCDYQMVIDTLDFLKRTVGIMVVSVPVYYPVMNDMQIIDSFQNELAKHNKVTMCIYSHITSMPSMTLPIEELTVLAKKKSAIVFVDGAHVPGVIDIDIAHLASIGVDYYTGNCHKWLFAPKGAAFLWVKNELQSVQCPQPSVISSSMKYDYVGRFEYTGTRDYTPLVAIPSAIDFIDRILGGGVDRMRAYNKQLLYDAFHLIQKTWNTFVLIPLSMNEFMCNIILPLPIHHKYHVDKLTTTLRTKYNISIVCRDVQINIALLQLMKDNLVKDNNNNINILDNINDRLNHNNDKDSDIIVYYVRLSAQVYLEISDYQLLANAVLQIIKEDKEYYYLNPC